MAQRVIVLIYDDANGTQTAALTTMTGAGASTYSNGIAYSDNYDASGILDTGSNYYPTGIFDGSNCYNAGIFDGSTYYGTGILNGSGEYSGAGIFDGNGNYYDAGIFDGSGYYNGAGILDSGSNYRSAGILDDGSNYQSRGIYANNAGLPNNYASIGILDAYTYYHSGILDSGGTAHTSGGAIDGSGDFSSLDYVATDAGGNLTLPPGSNVLTSNGPYGIGGNGSTPTNIGSVAQLALDFAKISIPAANQILTGTTAHGINSGGSQTTVVGTLPTPGGGAFATKPIYPAVG